MSARLPQRGSAWEIGVVAAPTSTGCDAVVLVVDAAAGKVRLAAPLWHGQAIDLEAALRPGDRPGLLPTELRVPDLATAKRISDHLGARLRIVESLPGLERAKASLVASFDEDAIGVQIHHPELARAAFHAFMAARPWRAIQESVRFELCGETGFPDGAVAVVRGSTADQAGVMVYEDMDALLRAMRRGATGAAERSWTLQVDELDLDALGADEHAVADAGLVTEGGLIGLSYAIDRGDVRGLDSDEDEALWMTVIGIARLVERHGGMLYSRAQDFELEVSSPAGSRMVVRRLPPSAVVPHPIFVPHQVLLTRLRLDDDHGLAVILKTSKGRALRVRDHFCDADHAAFEVLDGEVGVRLYAGERDLGVIVVAPLQHESRALLEQERIIVVISAGGEKRNGFRKQDVVWSEWVGVVGT